MRIRKLALAAAAAGLLSRGGAAAQQPASIHSWSAHAPAGRQIAAEYDNYYADYYAGQDALEPAEPMPPSPSDMPPEAAPAELAHDDGAAAACHSCDPCCDPCAGCDDGEPIRLFSGPITDCLGLEIGGFVAAGLFGNADDPRDKFNGPVTFNDREGEFQFNQIYNYVALPVDTGGSGFDIGGRIDTLYGTDWRFTPALGLETNVDGTMDWNQDNRFYGLAIPQLYAEVGYNNLSVKLGHFYTIIGYEVVPANGGFFTTHPYTHQYGEPFTHTGLLGTYALNDQWALAGGFHRGWDQWQDINNDLAGIGGVTWTPVEDLSVAFAVTSGTEDPAGTANRYMHSVVVSYKLFSDLTYIFESDLGHQEGAFGFTPGGADAEWYGINQYLLYDVNDRWSLGIRGEWFRDDDGFRVAGFGSLGGEFFGRGWGGSGFAGDFYDITVGTNYRYNNNILLRSEVRWDWYDGLDGVSNVPGNGPRPYDDGTDDNQFIWGSQAIITY